MIEKIWSRWNEFWFSPVSLLNLAVFRIVFCATMAVMYINRQSDVGLFYTDQGILPQNLALQILPEGMRPAFLLGFWPDSWVGIFHAVEIGLLLLMSLGVAGRWIGWMAIYLQLAFLFRNYSVAFGADQIGTIFLLYLAFTQSEGRLSIRSWWRQKKGKLEIQCDSVTSVFYRMIQIQLCVIYVYSGMEKLKGGSWWDGTAVWSVFANSQMVIADFTWIRHIPLIVVFITFSTIVFELYFPVLVWNQALRKHFLRVGVLFHAGIGLVMALWSFAIIMICPYVLFMREETLNSYLLKLKAKLVSK